MQRKSVAPGRDFARGRRGLSAPEVLVVVAIVAILALFVMMALPRQRESARLASCQNHLKPIGVGLVLYDQTAGHLPTVSALDGDGPSPLRTLLETLGLPDLTRLDDPKGPPPPQVRGALSARRVPGFVCPTDANAWTTSFAAPISYRATTGDAPDGRNGAFAPGRALKLATIAAGDGLTYSAAFAERLLGDGRARTPNLANYALVTGPLTGGPCPAAPPSAWRGDAGSSWLASDWRSTLYNHALAPNAGASCLAEGRRTAFMGASSSHVAGVNVLFCDGSVRTFTARTDLKIWREWADVQLPSP